MIVVLHVVDKDEKLELLSLKTKMVVTNALEIVGLIAMVDSVPEMVSM